jgi:hypothetical protein
MSPHEKGPGVSNTPSPRIYNGAFAPSLQHLACTLIRVLPQAAIDNPAFEIIAATFLTGGAK